MGLHRRIGVIQIQKDKLKELASQQRTELGRLEQDCSKLRAKRNIEQASLDLQSYSRSCIEDLTLAELQQLDSSSRSPALFGFCLICSKTAACRLAYRSPQNLPSNIHSQQILTS